MSASSIIRSGHRFVPLALLAAAMFAPSGAQAAGSHDGLAASAPVAGKRGAVAVTSRRHCPRGRYLARRNHHWTCKRIPVRYQPAPAPPPAPAPAPPPAPAPAPAPRPAPSIVDVTAAQADGWARSILARGTATNYRIGGCQRVNDGQGFCYVDLILPGVALYDQYLFNTIVGGTGIQNTFQYRGRFPL